MHIYELLDTHPPARRYGERSDGMRIQQKLCPLGTPSPFGEGWGGAFLKGQSRGLLKRPCPEPAVAAAGVVHVDVTTGEAQAVRAVAAPWGST